jgi:hypothetical protein
MVLEVQGLGAALGHGLLASGAQMQHRTWDNKQGTVCVCVCVCVYVCVCVCTCVCFVPLSLFVTALGFNHGGSTLTTLYKTNHFPKAPLLNTVVRNSQCRLSFNTQSLGGGMSKPYPKHSIRYFIYSSPVEKLRLKSTLLWNKSALNWDSTYLDLLPFKVATKVL